MPVRREALVVLVLPLLIAGVSGPPSVAGLRADDPFAPLLAVIGLLAWASAGWLLLLLVLATAGRAGSHVAHVALERIAPASLRALLGAAVGTAMALAVPSTTASAEGRPSPAVELDLDWGQPFVDPPASQPAPTRAALPVSRTPTTTTPPPSPDDDPVVVVQAGDSLWSIASRRLGPRASDRQIAIAWPRWWQANRALIGDNPDLIHPGAVLVRPQHLGEA